MVQNNVERGAMYSDCICRRAAARRQPPLSAASPPPHGAPHHLQRAACRGQGQRLKSEVVHHQYYDDISIIYFEYDLLQQLGQGGGAFWRSGFQRLGPHNSQVLLRRMKSRSAELGRRWHNEFGGRNDNGTVREIEAAASPPRDRQA